MTTVHPKLRRIEEDFKELDIFLVKKEGNETKINKIIKLLKEYSLDAYNGCVDFYKFYKLSNKYPESEIRERLKSKIRVYALKVQGLLASN